VADAAVPQERLARDELAGLVTALAGPAPCCLIVEGVSVHHGLKAVSGLRQSRTDVRESVPVKPVSRSPAFPGPRRWGSSRSRCSGSS
jgi:hypothetical protein